MERRPLNFTVEKLMRWATVLAQLGIPPRQLAAQNSTSTSSLSGAWHLDIKNEPTL
jgi:hypothetical protein